MRLTVPEECPELGWGNWTYPSGQVLRLRLTGGGWISLPLLEPRCREGLRGVAERVKVVWPRAHGDVDTLWELSPARSKASRVEGLGSIRHVVVLGISAV